MKVNASDLIKALMAHLKLVLQDERELVEEERKLCEKLKQEQGQT